MMIMVLSVAFVGNAVRALQQSAICRSRSSDDAPRLPIFLADLTGYHPTTQTILAQIALALVYLVGCVLGVRPRATPGRGGCPHGRAAPGPGARRRPLIHGPPRAAPSRVTPGDGARLPSHDRYVRSTSRIRVQPGRIVMA